MAQTSNELVVLRPNTASNVGAPSRLPPHNLDAEQALLAAILGNNLAYEKVSEFLRADHFYNPVFGKMYQAAITLIERGQKADAITLKHFFASDPEIHQLGGDDYLAQLTGSYVSIINAADYGQTIHDLHLRRQLINIGTDVVTDAFDGAVETQAIQQVEEAEQKLFQLATTGDTRGGFVSLGASLQKAQVMYEAAYKSENKITGVSTGLRDLDKRLGGLQRSDFIILAGRPSMGKTALATNIAFNAAKLFAETGGKMGAVTGFFSLEMSAEQLSTRLVSEHARVPSNDIRRGEIKREEYVKIIESIKELEGIPLYIDDTPALTIAALRTRARRMKRSAHGLGLIVIDYLQLMQGSGSRKEENRQNEVSEIARGLKAIAKELNVPVLALSQLSRSVETREDKTPQLSDLRESGAIEQDADVVMFVYREEYYHSRSEPKPRDNEDNHKFNERYQRWQENGEKVHNMAQVIIAKQRHGPIGTVELHFEGAFTRFSDLQQSGSDYNGAD
ncbi:MAG: replicative DNA helicase [Alphaproteobacteria bacterium]|nr:replicative DNA helicase [Alphaproteobacteria bacterium]